MIATHWIPEGIDFADFGDDPKPSPEAAATEFIQNDDLETEDEDQWHARHELIREGTTEVTVLGCVETNEPLAEDDQFDGYEPGCTYWKHTGEKARVRYSFITHVTL